VQCSTPSLQDTAGQGRGRAVHRVSLRMPPECPSSAIAASSATLNPFPPDCECPPPRDSLRRRIPRGCCRLRSADTHSHTHTPVRRRLSQRPLQPLRLLRRRHPPTFGLLIEPGRVIYPVKYWSKTGQTLIHSHRPAGLWPAYRTWGVVKYWSNIDSVI
jgi:hypothetical protein